jgi:hypothetical protein
VPIVVLFVLHSLWLIVDFFRRIYSTPKPKPNYITWLEPVLTGLDMDEELQYFEAHITWATPTTDDKLGEFERFEVEIAQVPYNPNEDDMPFDVEKSTDLEWVAVYSGPDVEITVSNLDALSFFMVRVHGKKTEKGAGFTGPIRKMTSPAMTAAVLRTRTGALSPLQHVLQVQNAKITALRSVVKRLQEGRTPEQVEMSKSRATSATNSPDKVIINFQNKRSEKIPGSPDNDIERSLMHSTRSILPSVARAEERAEREAHLKNQYNWRRLADIQVIQATAEPAATLSTVSSNLGFAAATGSNPAFAPAAGSPPKSLARAWTPETEARETGWRNIPADTRASASPPSGVPRTEQVASVHNLHAHSVGNTTSFTTSFTNPVMIRAKLGLDFISIGADGSAQRVAFRNELQQNFAGSAGLPPSCFVIKRLSPGSVLVDFDIHPDPSGRGPDPASAAQDLEQQSHNPASPLRQASLSRFVAAITISDGRSQMMRGTMTPFTTTMPPVTSSLPFTSPVPSTSAQPLSSPALSPRATTSSPWKAPPPPQTLSALSSPRDSILGANSFPRFSEGASNGLANTQHVTPDQDDASRVPSASAINIRPLGKTFGRELRDFEGTLLLEISTSSRVKAFYYTLNGSEPSPHNYDGSGPPPLTIKLTHTTAVQVMYVSEQGVASGVRSEVFVLHSPTSPEKTTNQHLKEWRSLNSRATGGGASGGRQEYVGQQRLRSLSPQRPPHSLHSSPPHHVVNVSVQPPTTRSPEAIHAAIASKYPGYSHTSPPHKVAHAHHIPGHIHSVTETGRWSVPSTSTPDNLLKNDKSGSLGLLLEQHHVTRRVFVKSMMPGGPAHKDGRVCEGDRLLSVDGYTLQGLDLSAVFEMIKGLPGTKAKLQIQREQSSSQGRPGDSLPNPGLPSLSAGSHGAYDDGHQDTGASGLKTTILQIDIERVNLAARSSRKSAARRP